LKRSRYVQKQTALEELHHELDAMVPLVRQVMRQTRARIFHGNTRFEGKLLSLFEPSTAVIRKGRAGRPDEFAKMVKLQQAENQIVVDYEVYDCRPNDCDLLSHRASSDACPADDAFYSARREAAAKAMGAKRVCISNRSTKSLDRKREHSPNGATGSSTVATGLRRHEPLGRARCDRRQSDQHQPRHAKASHPVGPPDFLELFNPRRTRRRGFAFRKTAEWLVRSTYFAPRSS
jgi:hypothetical protein